MSYTKPGVYTKQGLYGRGMVPMEKRFLDLTSELQYKVEKNKDLQLLVDKLQVLVEHSQGTRFKLNRDDVIIAGGSLVDLYLGREPKDYDVFINIPTRVFSAVRAYLHLNPTKISLVPNADEYCKKHDIIFKESKPNPRKSSESEHVAALIWISGLIANRFFGGFHDTVVPARDKLYDTDGLMVESHIEGISKPVQLCFNVNRIQPLHSFDLECCKIGLTLERKIEGSGLTHHFVEFDGLPTIKITERVVKYICKGVPPNARNILQMLYQYGVKNPSVDENSGWPVNAYVIGSSGLTPAGLFYGGASIALIEWVSGNVDGEIFGKSIPIEIVKYREFKKMLAKAPLTQAIVDIRKNGLDLSDIPNPFDF